MAWPTSDNNRKILDVIDKAISEQTVIRIRVKGEETLFTSKIIKIDHGSISSEIQRRPDLIIERLFPEKGNSLMRPLSEVAVEFSVNKTPCRCAMECIGRTSTPPHSGFIMGFPASLEIRERRREGRSTHETPEFFSAEIRLAKNSKRERPYELNVLNRSKHGLGLIITRKDFDLLRIVKKGDRLDNITLLASWAMIRVSGTVSHVRKIEQGAHKGCYLLGVHSHDIIESSKPNGD
jgi:hypothetical protein